MRLVLKEKAIAQPSGVTPALAPTKAAPVAVQKPTAVRVPLKARMVFFRQWATCIKAGMSMGAALHHLTGVTGQPELREAARKAQICVEGGGRLGAWMKTRPHVFSGVEAAYLHVGEVSGSLDTVIDRLATELETEYALRRRLFLATFIGKYCLLPMLLLVPNTPNIMMHGLDALAKTDPGLNEHAQQNIILRAGLHGYFQDLWHELWPIALVGALTYGLYQIALRTEPGRYWRDKLVLLIPLTGPLWRDLAVSRYLTALTLLTRAGVMPAAALEACARISGNLVLDEKFQEAARLARAHTLSIPAALAHTGIFSEMTLGLLRTGNQSGSMPAMLEQANVYQQSEIQNRLASAPKLVGTLCFLLCAVATAIVVGHATLQYFNNLSPAVDKFMGTN